MKMSGELGFFDIQTQENIQYLHFQSKPLMNL